VLGDVIITRKGCINSHIAAKGSIIIKRNDGFIKGGSYKAGNLIYAPEIGSRLSVTTIEAGSWFYTRKSVGPLKVIAPHEVMEIDPGESNLNFKVNRKGKFEIEHGIPDIEEIINSAIPGF